MLRQGHLKELLSDRGRTNSVRGHEQHQGPLKPPSPTRTIHMIIGGGDDASINSVKLTTTHKLKRLITRERYDELEESIIFDKLDTNGLAFPHYDALVITLQILDTDVRHIMSSKHMAITLPVLAKGVTQETTFHIMDQDTTYNAIIWQP
ncbi:uncharacterized protein [Nicotiana tomentosiformis]|uniref:uncharacterized protein n=1 Tax=Nicotiana tomentosiformis TaxID=4098 RepID=UPI00388CD54A